MALALIYIFATAKPISVRRLSALFVLALPLSTLALGALQVRGSQKDAILIAASLTLFAWITPLLQVVRDSMRYRLLALDALQPVSTFVRMTYGFIIAAAPIIGLAAALKGTSGLHLAMLLRLVPMAGLGTLLVHAGLHRSGLDWRKRANGPRFPAPHTRVRAC